MNNAEEYYNSHSTGYVDKWDLSEIGLKKPANHYRLEIINIMIAMAGLKKGDRVVEIGCGTGLVLREMSKVTTPLCATDISLSMLERVKDSLLKDKKVSIVDNFTQTLSDQSAEVFLMQNNLLSLNLPTNYFDKIMSMEVLRYVDNVPKALENVKEIMKPESIFVFTITNLFSLSFFPIKYSLRKMLGLVNQEKELLQYFVTEREIKRYLKEAGLKIVSFKKLNLLTFNPLVERLVGTDSKARKVVELDSFLSKVPIVNKFFDTFILAVKVDG